MPKIDPQKALSEIVPKFILPSLQGAFTVQASTPIKIKKIEAIKPSPLSGIDLLSSMGLKSSSLQGQLALFFPGNTFLGIVNRMLGEKYSEINDENADAAGELLNILYASARVNINQSGHDFLPSIPAVIRGNQVTLMHGSIPIIARIGCECEFGPFYLEMGLKGC